MQCNQSELPLINIHTRVLVVLKQLGLVFFLFFMMMDTAFGKTAVNLKITFDQNPVLMSDTLKTIYRRQLVNSSLPKLDENIYLSSCKSAPHLNSILLTPTYGNPFSQSLKRDEIMAIVAFCNGNDGEAVSLFTQIFEGTKDSIQKAKTCLNLVNVYYLNRRFLKAMYYLKTARDSLKASYTPRQAYQLVFTEAKIALSEGRTNKAENLMIKEVLPKSNRIKGKYNEFDCYLFLGKIYLKAHQFTQAKWFFIQANSLALAHKYIDGQIQTSLLLAKTKIKAGDLSVARQDLAKARRLIDGNHQIYVADLKQLSMLVKN